MRMIQALLLAAAATGTTAPAPAPLEPPVRVYAHRGASALRPEHTLAAYAQAIADGADFVEPDLVSSKDGVLLARHENEIGGTTDVAAHPEFAARRTVKTIDGERVEGWFSEDFTLAELKTLRARERLPQLRGTRWDGQFQLVTLDEIIDFVAAEAAARGRTVGIVPEIKHPSYFAAHGLAMEDKVLATLAAHAYTRRAPVEIQSFEARDLQYLRGRIGARGTGNIRLLQLLDAPDQAIPADPQGRRYRDLMTPAGLRAVAAYADAIGPDFHAVIPWDAGKHLLQPTTLVADAHAAGLQVHPYTFRPENGFLPDGYRAGDDPAARSDAGMVRLLRRYLEAGIDAFFTDDPALGRQAVDGSSSSSSQL
ncbi:MAG: glycerophosphodiester phosphodiesterase [Pseudoxanthomonas sp.]